MKQPNTAWVGYAEADITPNVPVQMVGFYRPDNTSQGVLHPLRLQTIVCSLKHQTVCLLAIDSLGFTVALSDTLRNKVAQVLNIAQEQVMLCFSHTHAAPNAALEPDYYQFVCRQAICATQNALDNQTPTYAAWRNGHCDIGQSRRQGQVDNRLGILALYTSGMLNVLILHVTAHANVLSSDNYNISSDYFGETRQRIERSYGCKVLMIQGAAGDIRPKFQQDNISFLEAHAYEAAEKGEEYQKKYRAQSARCLEAMAETIADAVRAIITQLQPKPIQRLKLCSLKQRFPSDVPTITAAEKIAQEAAKYAGIDGTDWLHEVDRLHQCEVQTQYTELEIQFFYNQRRRFLWHS